MQKYHTRSARQVESTFRPHAARIADRLRCRSRKLGGSPWHGARAHALERDLGVVAADCGTKYLVTMCNCTANERPALCGRYKFCETCLTKRRREQHVRMLKSLNSALQDNDGAKVYLCTITTWHSGSVAEDFRFLKKSIPEFLEYARGFGALGPYVYVYEMTNGDDGKGHVHAHIALLARWLDFKSSAETWSTISAKHGRPETPERKLQKPDYRYDRKGDPRRKTGEVASYLASHSLPSYLNKLTESEGLTDEMLGEWIGATYGKRIVITSRRFWAENGPLICKCCNHKAIFAGFAHDRHKLQTLLLLAMEAGFATKGAIPDHGESDWSTAPPG